MRAFTIIELIITVSLIAIIASVGFVNLVGYRERQSVKLASSGLVAVLRDAQNRSISEEQGVRWGVHLENPAGSANFYDLFPGACYSTSSIAGRAILSSGVVFGSIASGASTTIIFSTLTGFPSASATIIISLASNNSVSSTITISSNGTIQY